MPATTNRDLAEDGLWQKSLDRSRRRRVLAAAARKEQNRRKTASLAVSAAVVAAPVWPSVAGSGGFEARADTASGPKLPEGQERVLLSFGDRSPTVAALQRELRIVEDGIFGPQTEAAVRDFQKRSGLRETGDVDVRTWLAIFPDDAIVAAPSSAPGGGGEPQWAALTAPPATETAAAPAGTYMAADVAVPARSGGSKKKRRSSRARAAAVPTWEQDGTAAPGSGAVSPPPAEAPASPAPAPPATVAPPAPRGGPAPVAPVAPRPVPISPGGSVGEMIRAMIAEANRIDRARYPYRWGGGHNSRFTGPYDCSGAVSAVLHAAGLLRSPMVSGGFTRWGAPGRGLVTIYANASHVYMSIKGRYFGTTRANPGGGAGWFRGAPRRGFVVVHVPFERMKLGARARMKRAEKRAARQRAHIRVPRRARAPQTGTLAGGTAAPTYRPPANGTPTTTPAPAPQRVAPAPAPAPTAPTAPAVGQAPAPAAGQPAPVSVNTPAGSVTVTPPPVPAGGGQAPAGAAPAPPAAAPAPAEAPKAPAPPGAPAAGPDTQPSGAPAPQPAAPAPPAPSQPANPVGEVAKDAVEGVGEAAETVKSTLSPQAPAPADAPQGGPASE